MITTSTSRWIATSPPNKPVDGRCRKPVRSAGACAISHSTVACRAADDSEVRGTRAAAVLVVATLISAATMAPAPAVPVEGTTCAIFPSDNVWHLNVSKLPVIARSDVWKRAMHARRTFLHPDFGPTSYGIPFDVVDASHADSSVDFQYADESDAGPYPFGSDIHIEGGSDRHAIMLDQDTCTLDELYAAHWNGGSPTAGSGAVFDLTSNALRPAGWTSADAAGLSIMAGLLRYDEVAAGDVDHPIRVTAAVPHRGVRARCVRVAGSPRRRNEGPPVPADGRPIPPEGRVRRERLQSRCPCGDPCDEALRVDRR